jgi:hypothetical protein
MSHTYPTIPLTHWTTLTEFARAHQNVLGSRSRARRHFKAALVAKRIPPDSLRTLRNGNRVLYRWQDLLKVFQ